MDQTHMDRGAYTRSQHTDTLTGIYTWHHTYRRSQTLNNMKTYEKNTHKHTYEH
jgi:hypothetical protein